MRILVTNDDGFAAPGMPAYAVHGPPALAGVTAPCLGPDLLAMLERDELTRT